MKHKFLTVLAAIAIATSCCFALPACGDSDDNSATQNQDNTQSGNNSGGSSDSGSHSNDSASGGNSQGGSSTNDGSGSGSVGSNTGDGGAASGGSNSGDDASTGGSNEHTHSYTQQVVSPSCTQGGYTLHTCSCGDSYKDNQTAPAHKVVTDKGFAATCTTTGLSDGSHCSVCNTVIAPQTIIAKIPHTLVNNVCSVCEKSATDGLEYVISEDNTYYSVKGIGSVTSGEVIIPDTYNDLPVKAIESFAFQECETLTDIAIPIGVTEIGAGAFEHCENLVNVTIPEGVTSIPWCGFSDCISLTSITIPDSVTEIASNAFEYCTSLISVTIPEGVTSISSQAFYRCRGLTSVSIPGSVTNIGEYAFSECEKLTDLTISEGVKSIDEYAFYKCGELRSVVIPEGVTTIGKEAFSFCYKLISVTIPSTVTSIGEFAFNLCHSLVEVYNLSSLDIRAKVYSAENGSLGYNTMNVYTSLETPSKLRTTGDYIFYEDGDTIYLVAYTGNESQIVLPTNFNEKNYEIYSYVFDGYTSLTKITISSGITAIGYNAFYGCSNLAEVTIADSVSYVGGAAFAYCSALKSITLPEAVTYIGIGAFEYSGLTSITIPENVTYIGWDAFLKCTDLTEIVFETTADWAGTNALSASKTVTLYGKDLSDPKTAAKYLTDTYSSYSFKRK